MIDGGFLFPYALFWAWGITSWLEKENVTNPPIPLFSWQGSRPGANALAGLRLFPGSHWFERPYDSASVRLDFVLNFLSGLASEQHPQQQQEPWDSARPCSRQALWVSPEHPRLPPAACFRASKEGWAGGPSMLCSSCHSPLWSTMVADREICVTYSMTLEVPASCCDSAKTGNLL